MDRRKSIIITGAAIAALGIAGTSLAWFTDQDSLSNTMALGKIDIVLEEEEYDKMVDDDGIYKEMLVPGDCINKDLSISLDTGSEGAYIRIKSPKIILLNQDESQEVTDSQLEDGQLIIDGDTSKFGAELEAGWVQIGDTFYYTNPLKQGDRVYFLKEHQNPENEKYTLQIPTSWGSDYMNTLFSIKYDVEAIQSDNVTVDFNSENPWPDSPIVSYN